MRIASTLSVLSLCLAQSSMAAEVSANVYKPLDRTNYQKTFATWGVSGVKKIDALRKGAALKAAQSSDCDKVWYSELSDSRSAPPENIVILVECENAKRFFFNATDIQAGEAASSHQSKMKRVSDEQAQVACEKSVRASLEFPSSMSGRGKSVYRAPTGNIVVTFDFDSKNQTGAQLPYRARCVTDDRGQHPPEISGR